MARSAIWVERTLSTPTNTSSPKLTRLRNPNREVWEKFFADEAPWDALDYRAAETSGPPPSASSKSSIVRVQRVEPAPEMMTVEEAAAFLRINAKTLYQKIKERKVPGGIHVGGVVRVSKTVLLEAFRTGALHHGRRR